MIKITVKKGDITKEPVDAIVNPANSSGIMGGGVAAAIKKAAGPDVEKEAKAESPIYVGEAIMTIPGRLPIKGIIHAPTMKMPAMKIDVENVKSATNAALNCAEENKLSVIALPGMGTGVGDVSPDKAANAMIDTIKNYKEHHLTKIILIDINKGMINAWKEEVEK